MDEIPVLHCREGIENTEDGRLLVDGQPVAPGRYRLVLPEEEDLDVVLEVAEA